MTQEPRETIAIFSAHYLPHLGGIEQFCDGLATELEREGVHAVIVTNQLDEEAPAHEVLASGAEVFRLPCVPLLEGRLPLPARPAETAALLEQVAACKPTGVLVNARFYEHSAVGCKFAREQGIRPVVLDHGSGYIGFGVPGLDQVVAAHEHAITARLKRYNPAFWGISHKSCEWLRTFGINPAGEINNAIDAEGFRKLSSGRDFRSELGLGEGELLAAFTGRLLKSKGIDTLVEVARLLEQRGCPVRIAIAGSGPDEALLDAAPANISRLGRLSREDISALLGASDFFFFFSSYAEGMPTSLLEASVAGVPSLTNDVGGAREIIPDDTYGIVLENGSAEEFAEIIAWYAQNTDVARQQGERARKYVEAHFAWSNTAQAVRAACRSAQEDEGSAGDGTGPYPGDSLARLQAAELDILSQVDVICRENGLTYFLDGGSCLGALRHGGFIPWDDDVDIAMPYQDYERFCELAPEQLGEGYTLHTPKNTPEQAALWAKVCLDGTRFIDSDAIEAGYEQGIFVDVFPYRPLDADESAAARQIRDTSLFQRMAFLHATAHPHLPKGTLLPGLVHAGTTAVNKTVARLWEPAKLAARLDAAWETSNPGRQWANACYAHRCSYDQDVLFPPAEVDFDGLRLYAPANAERYLEILYGDWHRLPPESERYTHLPEVLDFGDGINVMAEGSANDEA